MDRAALCIHSVLSTAMRFVSYALMRILWLLKDCIPSEIMVVFSHPGRNSNCKKDMEEQPHRHQKKKRNCHHRRLSLLILLHVVGIEGDIQGALGNQSPKKSRGQFARPCGHHRRDYIQG
uniref:Uncharacterized protein n=1 Tax=Musa acuminata subsp. malaccensis TaxID=214687 RepID=A0A804KXJ1_MUSAM